MDKMNPKTKQTSQQKAKSKYQKSSKGKECDKRYYERNADALRKKQHKYNQNRREKELMYRKFYKDYINQHPEFDEAYAAQRAYEKAREYLHTMEQTVLES